MKFTTQKKQIKRAKRADMIAASIASLRELAAEFSVAVDVAPAGMIDEREVYEFLDAIAGCADEADLLFYDKDYKTVAEFFETSPDIRAELFTLWRDSKGCMPRDMCPLSLYDCEVAL